MTEITEEFLKDTAETWQPLSPTPLTEADCHEIAVSMIGFFSALARCAREAGQASAKIPGRRDAD